MSYMPTQSEQGAVKSRSLQVAALILLLPTIPVLVWAGAWLFRTLQTLGRDWGL